MAKHYFQWSISRGSEHRYAVFERRMCCAKSRKEIEGYDVKMGMSVWCLCNPGTALWEMIREVRACISRHVSLGKSTAYVHLHYLPND